MDKISFQHLKLVKPKKRTKDRQPRLIQMKPDTELWREEVCPYHLQKMKWDRNHERIYCKSTKKLWVSHSHTNQSLYELQSGKRFSDYKQHRKSLLK